MKNLLELLSPLSAVLVLGLFVGDRVGRDRGAEKVIDTCRLYGRYYVEPATDRDPMGYYINCNVTGGPEIAPNSSAGKKR
jgi:hypothetical protein